MSVLTVEVCNVSLDVNFRYGVNGTIEINNVWIDKKDVTLLMSLQMIHLARREVESALRNMSKADRAKLLSEIEDGWDIRRMLKPGLVPKRSALSMAF